MQGLDLHSPHEGRVYDLSGVRVPAGPGERTLTHIDTRTVDMPSGDMVYDLSSTGEMTLAELNYNLVSLYKAPGPSSSPSAGVGSGGSGGTGAGDDGICEGYVLVQGAGQAPRLPPASPQPEKWLVSYGFQDTGASLDRYLKAKVRKAHEAWREGGKDRDGDGGGGEGGDIGGCVEVVIFVCVHSVESRGIYA